MRISDLINLLQEQQKKYGDRIIYFGLKPNCRIYTLSIPNLTNKHRNFMTLNLYAEDGDFPKLTKQDYEIDYRVQK